MIWETSWRADPRARALADRHYSRQTVGAAQFVPPGRCAVFYAGAEPAAAYWVTSFPYPQFVLHAWAGAWMCSAFRNEGAGPGGQMILDALAATRAEFGDPPALGLVSFIDRAKVRPTMVRGVPTWGWIWRKVGFRELGETKGGLLALGIDPGDIPAARPARGGQGELWGAA